MAPSLAKTQQQQRRKRRLDADNNANDLNRAEGKRPCREVHGISECCWANGQTSTTLDGESDKRVNSLQTEPSPIPAQSRRQLTSSSAAASRPVATQVSAVSQTLRRLAQDTEESDGNRQSKPSESHNLEPEGIRTVTGVGARTSDEETPLDNVAHPAVVSTDMRRLMLISIAYIIFILTTSSAIIYAQHVNHTFVILQRDARHAVTTGNITGKHEQCRTTLNDVHRQLDSSRGANKKLVDVSRYYEAQIEEQKRVIQLGAKDLDDALERINILRRDKEESSAAMIESLTHQLTRTSREKDELSEQSKLMAAEHDLLQHNHNDIMRLVAPAFLYIQKLHLSSEQQRSIILELTSLVHSLRASVEVSQTTIEMQTAESMQAVTAISNVAAEQSQTFEMERAQYMAYMEHQLERLDQEAMGAVQAVAEAAGNLEYERKREEEERWRNYVAEAESIMIMNNNMHGNGDMSVLKTAVTRRIEKWIASLRNFVHPYNYSNEITEGGIKPMEIAESEYTSR